MFQGSGGFGGGFGSNAGGGGGGAGGGFGGGFNSDQSFTSPGGSKKPAGGGAAANKPSSVMPVTVAMMLKAEHNKTEDIFNYDGVDIHMVTFVGMVNEITEASTSITYKIDDYTGPVMSVRKFIQEGEDDATNVPQNSSYVRVYGHLRSLNEQRNVIAFAVTPLESHNEITVHMLEVIRAQLKLKKVVTGGMAGAPGGSFTAGSTNGNSNGNDSVMSGLNPSQQAVFNALKTSTSDIGMSIIEMGKNINHLSVVQIRSAIEFLSNEGHIYSTVDDEHYKLTDYC